MGEKGKDSSTWSVFKKLLRFYIPYRGYIFIALPCAVIVSLVPGSSVALVKVLVDAVFAGGDERSLLFVAGALVAIYFIKATLRFAQGYFLRVAGQKAVRDVRNAVFRHIQSLSHEFFDGHDTGSLISKMSYDVFMLQLVAQVAVDLIREPLTLLWLIGASFYLDWTLALIAIFVLPMGGFIVWKFAGRVREAARKGQEHMEALTTRMKESFTGLSVVRAFSAEETEISRFEIENEKFLNSMKGVIKYTEALGPVVEFLGAVGVALILIYGGMRVLHGEGGYTPGNFFAFIAAVGLMYEPFRKLTQIYGVLQQTVSAGERIFKLLETTPKISEPPNPAPWHTFEREVIFNNVHFFYGERPALRGVTFRIMKGEKVGVVGRVGSGKSTIIHLLLRYYDVNKGRILIDGYDIKTLSIRRLRENIALISQDVFLFNDTIMENVRYARLTASDEDVVNVCKLAGIHDFITSLPEGYMTVVGERGLQLSGGQRQKIAIARAFLKDSPIVIFDEATAHLDSSSEKEIEDVIFHLMEGKTVIIITHRLSFLKNTDRVIVLKDGRVVEQGRHDELAKSGVEYRRLLEVRDGESL